MYSLELRPLTNVLNRNAVRTNVSRIIQNKRYNAETHDNDIALIELFNPLGFNEKIKPIAIASNEEEGSLLSQDVTVSGWGATTEGGDVVRTLRFVNIPSVSRKDCNKPVSYDGAITDNMICGGITVGGKDSCQGDSGGPLIGQIKGEPARLVGIVSWGEGCARIGKYGVYTRASKYLDWIKDCATTPHNCM